MRYENWPTLLSEYLQVNSTSTFQWGTSDCCSFVCEWIHLCTGNDVYAAFRGRYKSAKGAYRLIKQVAGKGTVEAVADHVTRLYDMPAIPLLCAQRGDVVLSCDANGQRLGLVSLIPGTAVFLASTGFRHERVADCLRAWKV